jgi:hypothetical protein
MHKAVVEVAWWFIFLDFNESLLPPLPLLMQVFFADGQPLTSSAPTAPWAGKHLPEQHSKESRFVSTLSKKKNEKQEHRRGRKVKRAWKGFAS